jgi:hypothetical protein
MDVEQDADIDWQLPNKFKPGDVTGEFVIRLPNNIPDGIFYNENFGHKKRDCLSTTPVPIIH